MKDIWIYIESDGGNPTDVSLQCVSKALELAAQTNASISVLALGIEDVTSLIHCGADRVFTTDTAPLGDYIPTTFAAAVSNAIEAHSPDVVLFPSSTQGNDLASIVAAQLGVGCVLDCHALDLDGDSLLQTRLEYDGKVYSHFVATDSPAIATLHDGIADAPVADLSRSGDISTIEIPASDDTGATEIVAREIAAKQVNLKDAKIIVAGGAGVGSQQNFKLIEQLAEVLGGEVGATRPAVDAGWTDYERQIGQTGATVKPDLYIACGISGAVQHRVGMLNAGRIVAINSDPAAPIFRFAHVKIVGDLTEIIPKLIQLYSE